MKHVIAVALTIVFLASIGFAEDKRGVEDEKDKISYSVGYQVGGDFKRQGVKLNPEMLVKGIQDALSGTEPLMSKQEMNKTLTDLKKKIMAAQQEEQKKAAEKNLAEGKAFLAENKKKEGVKTTSSGLQYKIVSEGSGNKPKANDTVTVHYRGTLIDGSEFDSSYSRGKPASFSANRVIKGWQEALQMMKQGAKWKLFIPADLAYGQRSTGSIGPNSTLIFDVELISIRSAKQ